MLYLNGKVLPLSEGFVSVQDRGFLLGDGVYEVARVYNGVPFRMGKHLARLARSLEGIRIALPEPVESLAPVCRKLIGDMKEAIVYIQVTRGAAPRTHGFPKGTVPTVMAYAQEAASPPADKTFSLKSKTDLRWGRCDLKTINLLPNVLAKQEALEAGCDEALLVSREGIVREGASTNVFAVVKGGIVTHPATSEILGGVTREAVIEAAREAGMAIEERALPIDEFRRAEELFMTGTTTEVLPAVRLDGKAVGGGKMGPVTRQVREAFLDLVTRECR